GVRYVMGHPGGEVVDLIEGFREAGLEFILTRHEASAGFMADAMAAASGIPGVCVGTLGPGATNLVTGVAQAFLDRSPVLAFTGQLPMARYEITTHQKLDLRALFAPVTKWQAQVSPANAGPVMDRALRTAMRPRRGPVYLEVPSDVPLQDAHVEPRAASSPPHAWNAIDADAAGQATRRLHASARPVIVVGMDANDDVTSTRLRAFAEHWAIPVIDSPKSKGVFPEDHPLFLGTIEMLGTARLYEMINTCDLVLMVGMDPVELDRDWTASAEVVHIGPLPNDDRVYRASVELVGPVHEAFDAIRSLAGAAEPKWKAAEVKKLRDDFRAFVAPKRALLTAQQVLVALRAALPANAIATCDVGYNKAVTGQCWTAYTPRTFFMSNGLSSMGYGLPAALGLQLLHRDRRVACILGDGGFAMSMAELETAVRLELPVIAVILADQALSQIKASQARKGFEAVGTTFRGLDYISIARGFGVAGYEVATEAECRDAFAAARDSKRPTLIAAHVDPTAYKLA
ncbi:MAG: thiamine pyrophosphate-binding protein, partial [Chloroflexota bacterium]|nr:thiamine pyrophosphate-binding protein [Chloroflexota bacterium]